MQTKKSISKRTKAVPLSPLPTPIIDTCESSSNGIIRVSELDVIPKKKRTVLKKKTVSSSKLLSKTTTTPPQSVLHFFGDDDSFPTPVNDDSSDVAVTTASLPSTITGINFLPIWNENTTTVTCPSPLESPRRRPSTVATAVLPTVACIPPPPMITSKSSYTEWISTLPAPSVSVWKHITPKAIVREWMDNFKLYLSKFLTILYSDETFVFEKILNSDVRLDVFRRALTDASFASDNYETLETIGDKALAYAFSKHLYSRFKGAITDREISNYNSNYMSKRYQAELATEMRFDKWVLMGKPQSAERSSTTTQSIREDTFESFAAALDFVANDVHQESLSAKRYEEAALLAPPGHEIVRRLIDFIFDSKGIDPKFSVNASKSTLLDIASLMGLRRQGIRFDSPPEGTVNPKHSVFISRELAYALNSSGVRVNPNSTTLSSGFPDKTTAADAALNVLKDGGFTEEWMRDERSLSRLESLPANLRDGLNAVKKEIGVTKYIFHVPDGHVLDDGRFTVNLVGVRNDDSQFLLGTALGYRLDDLKTKIAQDYLASRRL